MTWQAYVRADVPPHLFWSWASEFRSNASSSSHTRPLLFGHSLGHGVIYYSLFQYLKGHPSKLSDYSACRPFRVHSVKPNRVVGELALKLCNEAPSVAEIDGCKDGLAHTWYLLGFNSSHGRAYDVCKGLDDVWCYHWYQSYLQNLTQVLSTCTGLRGLSRLRCVFAVSWSRFPVYDAVV